MKLVKHLFLYLFSFCMVVFAQPSVMDLYFTSLKINQEKMAEYCTNVSKQYEAIWKNNPIEYYCNSSSTAKDYLNGGIRAVSLIDTTVEIYFYGDSSNQWINLTRITQNCVGDYPKDNAVGVPGTHQFSEVFEAELMRFQENEVIFLSKDSLKKVIDKAVNAMIEKNKRCVDLDLSSYEEPNGSSGSLLGLGCCSLVNSPSALPAISWAPSNIRITKTGENGFLIQSAKIGSAYALFDLNGKVLEQGALLSRTIQPPMLPAVLKIQERTMLLK